MPNGLYFLIGAHFFIALTDNALLILGISYLNEQNFPNWFAPLLKFDLTLAYFILASVVGPISDAMNKRHLMLFSNCLKILGVLVLLAGPNPFSGFALIGFAAALYTPSKFGFLIEFVPSKLLVRANAWFEVSVVLAAILGIGLGGQLLSFIGSDFFKVNLLDWLPTKIFGFQSEISPALWCLTFTYAIAFLLHLCLLSVHHHSNSIPLSLKSMSLPRFWQSNRQLWLDPLGGLSLYITTLYWGVGAVVQYAVLVWAQEKLELPLSQSVFLQIWVALGVILGANVAGRKIKMHSARQATPWGILLALSLPSVVLVSNIYLALCLLLCIGFSGGMLLVPMNALLQHRGKRILGAGQSIAVQAFNENFCVLIMVCFYSVLIAFKVPLGLIMLMVSGLTLIAIVPISVMLWRKSFS